MGTSHVYRIVEVVGTSPDGIDDAIQNAISRVSQTTPHLDWFEVTQIRGDLADGKLAYTQVSLKIGSRITAE